MSHPLQAAIAALTEERSLVSGRLDTIDLALDNLRRLAPTDAPPTKAKRVIAERRVVERRHGARRAGKATSDNRVLSQARMDAVIKTLRLNGGTGTSKALRAAMPKEPTLTDSQRAKAFSNVVTKLKAKGLLGRTGDTYSLVGAS